MNRAQFQIWLIGFLNQLKTNPSINIEWMAWSIADTAECVSSSKGDRLEIAWIQSKLEELERNFANHKHIGNAGYPTSEPTSRILGATGEMGCCGGPRGAQFGSV